MKLYVKASDDFEDMDYLPDVSVDADDIVSSLTEELEAKFQRRYKNLQVDIHDTQSDNHSFATNVTLYNNGKLICEGPFSFKAYDSYFDSTDYIQHLNTSIYRFVSNLTNR